MPDQVTACSLLPILLIELRSGTSIPPHLFDLTCPPLFRELPSCMCNLRERLVLEQVYKGLLKCSSSSARYLAITCPDSELKAPALRTCVPLLHSHYLQFVLYSWLGVPAWETPGLCLVRGLIKSHWLLLDMYTDLTLHSTGFDKSGSGGTQFGHVGAIAHMFDDFKLIFCSLD